MKTTIAPLGEWDLSQVEIAPDGKKYLTNFAPNGQARLEVSLQVGDRPVTSRADKNSGLALGGSSRNAGACERGGDQTLFLGWRQSARTPGPKRKGAPGRVANGDKRRAVADNAADEFRAKFIGLRAADPDRSANSIYKELGVNSSNARRWLKKKQASTPAPRPQPSAAVDLYRHEKAKRRKSYL